MNAETYKLSASKASGAVSLDWKADKTTLEENVRMNCRAHQISKSAPKSDLPKHKWQYSA
jgi:hypothetical protein